jgi:GntR family transcriptional regulator
MTSIALDLFTLTPGGPIHQQLAAAVRRLVGQGSALPGDRLPSATDLASHLGVNRNTVLRAYRELARDSLVDLRPGRGATIADIPSIARLYQLADDLVAEATRLGVTRGELTALLVDRM